MLGVDNEFIISLHIVILSLVLEASLPSAFAEWKAFVSYLFEVHHDTRAVWLHAFQLEIAHMKFLGSSFAERSLRPSSNLLGSDRSFRKL